MPKMLDAYIQMQVEERELNLHETSTVAVCAIMCRFGVVAQVFGRFILTAAPHAGIRIVLPESAVSPSTRQVTLDDVVRLLDSIHVMEMRVAGRDIYERNHRLTEIFGISLRGAIFEPHCQILPNYNVNIKELLTKRQ